MIKNKELLFTDWANFGPITKTVKEQNKKRKFTGGVRIAQGMYRTDEETKIYLEKSLNKRLP